MLKHAGDQKLVSDSLAQRLIELITKGPFTKLDDIVQHAALVFLKQVNYDTTMIHPLITINYRPSKHFIRIK